MQGTNDDAVLLVQFANGVHGTIHLSIVANQGECGVQQRYAFFDVGTLEIEVPFFVRERVQCCAAFAWASRRSPTCPFHMMLREMRCAINMQRLTSSMTPKHNPSVIACSSTQC